MTTTGLDRECASLCNALNLLPGICTVESCCGHGEWPFRIWFVTKGLRYLPRLCYWFDGCHCGCYDWHVVVSTDCAMNPVTFRVEGPTGRRAFEEAEKIAKLIIDAT